jgi:hypothetical protein
MTRWPTVLRLLIAIAVTTAALGAAAAHAATSTVTFDDQSGGTLVGSQYAASSGVTFMDPPSDTVRVTDAPGFAHSGSEVAALERTCLCEDFSPLDAGVNLSTTASAVSAWVGYFGMQPGNDGIELVAYDAGDNQIASSSVATVAQGSPMQQITVTSATANIARVDLVQVITEHEDNGDKLVADDLAVTTPDTAAPADFSLTNGMSVLDVLQGQSLSDPITINRLNGSNGDVAMSVSGLPAGMTGTFSPNPVPGTSNSTMLTVSAAPLSVATTDYSNATITGTPSSAAAGPAPRSATAVARISENCTHRVTFDYVDLRDTGCLSKSGNTAWQAVNTEVHVDGLVLTPRDRDANGNAVLTVDSAAKTIQSESTSTWSVTLQGYPNIPIYYGPIRWSFKDDYTGPVPLDQNSTGKPKEVEGLDISGTPLLQGIPITGIKAVFTTKNQAIVTPTFTLDFFPLNYFGALSVSGSFTTDNDNGVNFSGLEFKIPKADILGLELRDVDVKYVDSGTFSGQAKVVLAFDDNLTVGAGYGIKNGNFDFLKGSVDDINTPIGSGIYLQGIAFELDTNPTKITGQISLSAGPQVAGKTALTIDGGVTAVLADPWVVEVDGDAKIAGKYTLASAFVRYSSYGLFEFGGKVHFSLDPIYVDGSVNGWVAGLSNFDVEGAVNGCVDVPILPDPCAGAKVLISSIGVAGCVQALGYGVGAGYTWGGSADAFTGCDLSPWRPVEPTGGADAPRRAGRAARGRVAAARRRRGGARRDGERARRRAAQGHEPDPVRPQQRVHRVPVGRRQHVRDRREAGGRRVDDRQRERHPDHARAPGGRAAEAVGLGVGVGARPQARAALEPEADQGPGRDVRRDRQGLAPRDRQDARGPRHDPLCARRRVGRDAQDRGDCRAGPPPPHHADRRPLPGAGDAEADPGSRPEDHAQVDDADRQLAAAGRRLPPRGLPHGQRQAPPAVDRRRRQANRLVPRDRSESERDGDRHRADQAQRQGRDGEGGDQAAQAEEGQEASLRLTASASARRPGRSTAEANSSPRRSRDGVGGVARAAGRRAARSRGSAVGSFGASLRSTQAA